MTEFDYTPVCQPEAVMFVSYKTICFSVYLQHAAGMIAALVYSTEFIIIKYKSNKKMLQNCAPGGGRREYAGKTGEG